MNHSSTDRPDLMELGRLPANARDRVDVVRGWDIVLFAAVIADPPRAAKAPAKQVRLGWSHGGG
jgi:hypothetical protein